MSTVTFDTLDFTRRLKEAGFDEKQAESVVRVLTDAQKELITKTDLQIELAPVKSDLNVLKWMSCFTLAFILAVLWKVVH